MSQYEEQLTEIWKKYEKSRDYLQGKGLIEKTNENWRFYLGDQWHGLESGGERLPSLNFIKGIVRYKTAVIAQNAMTANYSPMGHEDGQAQVCELLNEQFRRHWELGKMDTNLWEIVKAAQIQGDAYLFYGTPSDMQPQILANVNVLLSDEQEQNIQSQKYIMIYERRFVSDVRKEAKENKVEKELLETIVSDEETEYQLGNITEVKESSGGDGKCASILYLCKDEQGIVHMSRSTKTCIYQPDTALQGQDGMGNYAGAGLKSYPIVSFIWERIPNNARGQSEVRNLIPNQLELNKTLARRSMAVKLGAFPRLAYDETAIENPEALDSVGMKVAVRTNAGSINNMIAYLNPTSMSPDAKNLSDELMNATKELSGAGEAATGAIDPTQASGNAIIAVKNQNELPLNESVATKTQFVEDLALLWFDVWAAYNPQGIEVDLGEQGGVQIIPADVLLQLRVNVRVDISQANPFSKLAQEQALERMLESQQLTFEEYIDALDDDSNVPKAKIKDILEKRKQQQQDRMAQQLQKSTQTIDKQSQLIAQLSGQPTMGASPEMQGGQQMPLPMEGGMPNEMPPM